MAEPYLAEYFEMEAQLDFLVFEPHSPLPCPLGWKQPSARNSISTLLMAGKGSVDFGSKLSPVQSDHALNPNRWGGSALSCKSKGST